MNIGIDIRPLMSPLRTGVAEYTFELINALVNIDLTNQYYLFYNSYQDITADIPQWQKSNVHYIAYHWPNKIFNMAMRYCYYPKIDNIISKSIAEKKLDIFFSTNLNFLSLTKKTKFILTVHDLSFNLFPEFYPLKWQIKNRVIQPKKQCQRANIILTPSDNTKRDLIDIYKIDSQKITTIYPGIKKNNKPTPTEQQIIRNKYQLPQNFILFLGTTEPRKNIIDLIAAFEKASPLLPATYYLVIAGAPGWKNKKIFKRIKESSCHKYIKILGYIDHQDKSALYAISDLFVYPSFYEGFGFPVFEAMTAGTPVITTNRSSLPEITAGAAYLINPNKPSELATAIIEILNNKILKNRLIESGYVQADKFCWETTAQKFLEVLNRLNNNQ
ncbi:MAG: glycosyltransferase family 1 protein [Candidatus Magasanikbacteria bacterium]